MYKMFAEFDLDMNAYRNVLQHAKHNSNVTYPKIRVGDNYIITLASVVSKNPHFIYIKHNKNYIGKVSPNHVFYTTTDNEKHVAPLQELSKNPEEMLTTYGRETGECGICGRELTLKESIDRGIGPICFANFFGNK